MPEPTPQRDSDLALGLAACGIIIAAAAFWRKHTRAGREKNSESGRPTRSTKEAAFRNSPLPGWATFAREARRLRRSLYLPARAAAFLSGPVIARGGVGNAPEGARDKGTTVYFRATMWPPVRRRGRRKGSARHIGYSQLAGGPLQSQSWRRGSLQASVQEGLNEEARKRCGAGHEAAGPLFLRYAFSRSRPIEGLYRLWTVSPG